MVPERDSRRPLPTPTPAPVKRSDPKPVPAANGARSGGAPQAVKRFVIDTNVLLHNPDALFVFEENDVIVPFAVLEELDRFKGSNDDLGRAARQAIRNFDKLRAAGRLIDGVPWGSVRPTAGPSGTVRIDIASHERPDALHADTPDNRIITVAYNLHKAGQRAVFVSKDINARIKADALGIRSEDFENQKVDADRLYSGYVSLVVPGATIDELYQNRMLLLDALSEARVANGDERGPNDGDFVPDAGPIALETNQFVILKAAEDPSHTGLARRLADTDHVIPVTGPRKPVFGLMARNVQQTMALDLLLDDEIKLVTLLGTAGTGKTLLALAAGMNKVFQEERYDRLLCARPIMPLGRDIGYLPGSKDEKLEAWMQPIFDNLEYLLSTRGSHMQAPESHTPEQRVKKLIADGRLVLEPLTYIRGRSIPHQFMIVDEAQNLTPHEVKTIISRVGDGTRLILTGDIGQIDNPYLDSSSNGLSYAVEKMKGLGLAGHVTLARSERSELASIAASRL
ncbi:MAG: PhoH family protein [Phycisphaerales bacterium]|nr:PhoH family protein [Phycisphaerales bacterium]